MADSNPNVTTFASVGGLTDQIQTIKDLILFPLQHKQLSTSLNMRVPRGCLFHGPPGTGKTLVASALANECSNVVGRKVSFFSHKGSDILGCYLGESEKNLRQVFARARLFAPALIFFDEIDSLAPARSSLGGSHHVYTSVVSVLLTEMDGVGCGGDDVFVIGATNRLEAIDPALRRPGRFDSELRFELPNEAERRAIIRVHVSRWRPAISEETVAHLAAATHGHCGADLAAICTKALLAGIKRTQPRAGSTRVDVSREDFARACSKLVPASHRSQPVHARRMAAVVEPLFRGEVNAVVDGLRRKYPYGFVRGGNAVGRHAAFPALSVPRVLVTGSEEHGHTQHLAPAILHSFDHLPVVALDEEAIFGMRYSPDMACAEVMKRVRSSLPCVLYAPNLTGWWRLVGKTTQLLFASFIGGLDPSTELLIVATAHEDHADLPAELQRLFVDGCEVHRVRTPRDEHRTAFFSPLILGGRDEDSSESDGDSGDDSQGPTSTTWKAGSASKGVRSGRVQKAPKRATSTSSSKSAPAGPTPPADPRADLLRRLVSATRGLGSQPLERAYSVLKDCLVRWQQHNEEERLLADFARCIAVIERDAQERREDDLPDYLS